MEIIGKLVLTFLFSSKDTNFYHRYILYESIKTLQKENNLFVKVKVTSYS